MFSKNRNTLIFKKEYQKLFFKQMQDCAFDFIKFSDTKLLN